MVLPVNIDQDKSGCQFVLTVILSNKIDIVYCQFRESPRGAGPHGTGPSLSMNVVSIGLNHHSAPLDVRSRFAVAPDALGTHLLALRSHLEAHAGEAAILSTCNRTELYVATHGGTMRDVCHAGMAWLSGQGGLSAPALNDHLYVREGGDSARHAFRVASGLDSMVIGEPQILGQMKAAVRQAGEVGTLGSTLHQLFQRSFSVAKAVRTRTEIGAHSVSMAAAVVKLAEQIFEDWRQLKVLFVGAGEMIELVATHVAARKPSLMVVANRSAERAAAVQARTGASTMPLSAMPSRLQEFDVVVSCTASALPLIGLGAVERALVHRRRRPMLMIDLAVPRDIEPEVARLSDVFLYTVDDLAGIVREGATNRQAAMEQAELIIDEGVRSFEHWMGQRRSVPLIRALNERAEQWAELELQRARRRLGRGEDIEAVLQALTRGLTGKLMHGALQEIHASDDLQRRQTAETLGRLFRLPQSPAAAPAGRCPHDSPIKDQEAP